MSKTYFPLDNEEYLNIDRLKDDDLMYHLKTSIMQNLNAVEKNILLIYVDKGSYAKAAEVLGIAKSTLMLRVNKIKKKLNIVKEEE